MTIGRIDSVVRFPDYNSFAPHPSSELLGYCQPSADADLKSDLLYKTALN